MPRGPPKRRRGRPRPTGGRSPRPRRTAPEPARGRPRARWRCPRSAAAPTGQAPPELDGGAHPRLVDLPPDRRRGAAAWSRALAERPWPGQSDQHRRVGRGARASASSASAVRNAGHALGLASASSAPPPLACRAARPRPRATRPSRTRLAQCPRRRRGVAVGVGSAGRVAVLVARGSSGSTRLTAVAWRARAARRAETCRAAASSSSVGSRPWAARNAPSARGSADLVGDVRGNAHRAGLFGEGRG